ncbi:winged helix-turn-helix transcriptional regulator [Agrilactobacillus yilanensis]|uniref:Winged helix-turn-helix transcriptional regulator n=1 Tax=Agrilactobacillus yilanensis TaxID=2485997 RepID=A0ABW4J7J0_9LACO|nr:helix-turn-helix domain-containing protein [Agrilactobacillus yilanensis]
MYANEFDATMQMIRGKWKILILYALDEDDHRRFNDLQRTLKPVTHKILAEQLQQLLDDGLITRQDFDENPPHVEYHLTPMGQSLVPLLDAICDWGVAHVAPDKMVKLLCDE